MIKSFKHKGLEKFYATDSKAGIIPEHAKKLRQQLSFLDEAVNPQDMNYAGWFLHSLHGSLKGHWSVRVNGNWRLTFCFIGSNVELVDYKDYH